MNSISFARKTQRLVLIGGGHAHALVLKKFAMLPRVDHLEIFLVAPTTASIYSGLVPAFVAGDVQEPLIDLVPLVSKCGGFFVEASCIAIDPIEQTVQLSNGSRLYYDYVSFNIGSLNPELSGFDPKHLRMIGARSFGQLGSKLAVWQKLDLKDIVVIGAGAAAFEMSLALASRFRTAKIRLICDKPLPLHWKKALGRVETTIGLVERIEERSHLEVYTKNQTCKADAIVIAAGARAPKIFANADLAASDGYLEVTASLNTPVFSNVFGAGDCIHFRPTSGLPKAGVYSVRESQILAKNLFMSVHGRYDYLEYRPQKKFLKLLNCSDGTAILEYGSLHGRSTFFWQIKQWIDQKFLQRLSFAPVEPSKEEISCGGCGSKLASDILHGALKSHKIIHDDAALWRGNAWSVDYYKNFGADPRSFGQIAAISALSDIYAKGVKPESALAIATVAKRSERAAQNVLESFMDGANSVFDQEGVELLGGHSSEGLEDALGFSVVGQQQVGRWWPKNGAKCGDVIIVTKALGTGTILAAAMQGEIKGIHWSACLEQMRVSPAHGWQIMQRFSPHAATDITGFGLLGHLREMNVGCVLDLAAIPFLPGAKELHSRGFVSRMTKHNQRVCEIEDEDLSLLTSPETAGGVLFVLDPENGASALLELQKFYPDAAIIGRFDAQPGIRVRGVLL